MYLEKGIEEFGENHKPSPFMICCPYCGGWAMDVSGIQKIPGGGYMPLPDGASYFANKEDRDCGVPVFYNGEYKDNGKWIGALIERIMTKVLDAIQRIAHSFDMCSDPTEESGEFLDFPTAWDRKEAREKQQDVERAAASRFRQYKARTTAWKVRKRTNPRKREWHGPWREEKRTN